VLARNPILRKSAAVGLLVLAGIAAYAAVVAPLMIQYRTYGQQIDAARWQLLGYNKTIQRRRGLLEEAERLRARAKLHKGYINGGTAALAGASLQQHIQSVVGSRGGQIFSMQALAHQPDGHHTRVGIRVYLRADTGALQKILYRLESGTPLLIVDQVRVRRLRTSRQQPNGLLDASFDVYGYRRGPT
jgi:general secretion pathway protein M